MSTINVWVANGDAVDVVEDEVTVKVDLSETDEEIRNSFNTESEELAAVRHILQLMDDADEGDVIVITKEIY